MKNESFIRFQNTKKGALITWELKGKLDGLSMRVPTPDGSVVDLTVESLALEEDLLPQR